MSDRCNRDFFERARRVAACAGLAVVLGVPAGCGESPTARAVERANVELVALSPGAGQPALVEHRRRVYSDVVSSLKPVADKGTRGEKAAAWVLISQAEHGLAQTPADVAAGVMRSLLADVTAARGSLAQWVAVSALARAAEDFDPAPELADIEKQTREREGQIVEAEQRRRQIEERVAEIRRRGAAKAEQARERRQAEGMLRQRMLDVSAVEGAEILNEAVAIKRQADQLEVEAATLEGQASVVEPEIAEAQNAVERLTRQREMLQEARRSVLERAQAAKEDAAAARAQATEVAGQFRAEIEEMARVRDEALEGAFDEAVGHLKSASDSARRARDEARETANMASGTAQQSLGDLNWTLGHGLGSYAELLEAGAGADPSLPDAARYAEMAEQARQRQREALDAAAESYGEAVKHFEGAGRGEAQQRLERVNQGLAESIFRTSGGSKDLRAQYRAAEPAAAEGGEGAGGDSPTATIEAILSLARQNNFPPIAEYIYTDNPTLAQALRGGLNVAGSAARLSEACKSAYGQDLSQLLEQAMATNPALSGLPKMGGAGMGGGMNPMGAMPEDLLNISASDFRVEIEGETASVYLPPSFESEEPMPMRSVNGVWMVDLSTENTPEIAVQVQMIEPFLPLLAAAGMAMDQVAAKVESGAYSSGQVAMNDLMLKLQPLIMQAMGQMQQQFDPSGGPGGG